MQPPRRSIQNPKGERRRRMRPPGEIAHGHICEIHPAKGFGRIETPDGRVIYFYKDSVEGRPFVTLTTGTEVRFVEEADRPEPRASVVHVID